MKQTPSVLCIGGHDPTGGAGLQADIETVSALGVRALTLVTALTAQDTSNIRRIENVSPDLLAECFDTLVSDIEPNVVKIGLLASVESIRLLTPRLADLAAPLVIDPVLAAGGGYRTADAALVEALVSNLAPIASLMTPNRAELRRLGNSADTEISVARLLDTGCRAVLATGADEASGDTVENRLWQSGHAVETYRWPRLHASYHGSGCTLASACAAGLASGLTLTSAVAGAQRFTHDALSRAESPGGAQRLPNRRVA